MGAHRWSPSASTGRCLGARRRSSFCHRQIIAAAASCFDRWERATWLDLFSESAQFLAGSALFPTGSAQLSQSSAGSFWLVAQLHLAGSR
jgi:hypothetical protein